MNGNFIDHLFQYHQPSNNDVIAKHQRIREACRKLAHLINDICPESPESTLAIRSVHEASMYANAAVAMTDNYAGKAIPQPRGGDLQVAATKLPPEDSEADVDNSKPKADGDGIQPVKPKF